MDTAPTEFEPTTAERVARNEDIFRDANERVRETAERYGYDAPVPFVCECAEPSCQDLVSVELEAYADVRANPRWFLIAPGHEVNARGYGEVVSRVQGYVVVEKTGRAGEVAEALAGEGEGAVDDERDRRVGLNEALFREINERVKELNETFATFTGTMDILCECGSTACLERIAIRPTEYEEIRADATHFAVVPGHEIPEVEEVVEQRDGYDVIRKHAGIPAQVAEQTDPRS